MVKQSRTQDLFTGMRFLGAGPALLLRSFHELATHSLDERRWSVSDRPEDAGGRLSGACDGKHSGAQPGAERRGAIPDAAPADRLPQRGRTAMGGGRHAGREKLRRVPRGA